MNNVVTISLKTKACQFDNFVVTDGIVSCHDDNLWCHQWRQSCQIDDHLFSAFTIPQSWINIVIISFNSPLPDTYWHSGCQESIMICGTNNTVVGWFVVGFKFVVILTLLPLDKMAGVSQTTVSYAFSWMKIFVFRFKFHWSLLLRVQLTISEHWFR